MVSHDREFLNSVTTDIIHLHDERLHYYRGNFAQVRRQEGRQRLEGRQRVCTGQRRRGSTAPQYCV